MYLKMSNTSGKYSIVNSDKINEFCISEFNCYNGIIKFKVQGYNKSYIYNTSTISMEIPKHLCEFSSSDIYELASMILVYKLNEMDKNTFIGISLNPPATYRPKSAEVGDSFFVSKFGMISRYPYCLERVQIAPMHNLKSCDLRYLLYIYFINVTLFTFIS